MANNSKLTLTVPLVFFETKTTGRQYQTDRIIQIFLLKLFPDNREETLSFFFNPGIPIPEAVTAVHGISNNDVINKPKFKEHADEIFKFILGCDIAGYNIHRFDLPILRFEFNRVGINYDIMGINIIDPMVIFKKKESRGLKTAYLFYCDRALENAHDAEVVTRAAKEIFLAQLEYYNDIGNNLNEISAFSSYDDFRQADISRKLLYNENSQLIFNYGKHRHKLAADHLDHVQWVLDNDFPEDTKEILRDFLNNR